MTTPLPALPAIEARDLRVTRGEKAIVRGVTVAAQKGEVLGVLGPSGAGKSTLFRAMVGEIPAASGEVRLFGEDVSGAPLWARARQGVAYLPQTPSVLWDLSVRDNLRAYHRVVHGGPWLSSLFRRGPLPGEDEAIKELSERVALDDRMDLRAGELSGGERRRLELARALTRPPKVLVCDEPFAGVDPQQASRLGDMLRALADQHGVAVLLADHHVAEALRVCTRAILLLDGQVAIEAEPGAFEEHPLVVGRYLGNWGRTFPPPLP
ncbi:ABC transporter, ATP-binding protein [Labilithrix luteola]|uniref:ABC transporter, ATP-binding protein n=1 Tax=Labilithrix luteola TaxID=1391654 RepID=A0A0K1QA23_9BACT|nr:ABC transporter ATP-binding protein [Labilithrix luteola]AKV02588.1 ABC transporter, ATP-binding protein [Labilithrix luteola]